MRRARESDAGALAAIERSAAELFHALPNLAWIADEPVPSTAAQQDVISRQPVWVGEIDGRAVAFLIGELCPDALHIAEVSVHRDWHRHGIGRLMIQQAEVAAVRLVRRAITLTTFRAVAWNAPYYQRLGFKVETEPSARLASLLASEIERGFVAGSRCAMRKALV